MAITNTILVEQMAQKLTTGKNKLWFAFQDADPLVKDEILLRLKKLGLYRHWYSSACKSTHNLLKPQPDLRDLFLELIPETAPLFGLQMAKSKGSNKKKEKPIISNAPTLFD